MSLNLVVTAADWMDRALCRGCDPDLWFPKRGEPTDEARAICGQCPVWRDCLNYALDNGEKFGMWGGKSERERRRIRRDRQPEGGTFTLTCRKCDARFRSRTKQTRYCSDECRAAAHVQAVRRYQGREAS